MSQNFVTPNELDQRLGAYERLGESQKACGQMEESLKKYVRAQVEATQMQITTLVEERAVQLYQKVDVQAKKYMDNLATHKKVLRLLLKKFFGQSLIPFNHKSELRFQILKKSGLIALLPLLKKLLAM